MARIVMAIALVMIVMGTSFASQPPSATALKDDLKFTVSLAKSEFIEGEPIIVTFTLMNDSDKPRMLFEPEYFTTGCRITQISGARPLPPTTHGDGCLPDACEFKSQEIQVYAWDVQNQFTDIIPAGEYTMKASCLAFEDRESQHGYLKAPELCFKVVEPTGVEAEASRIFCGAKKKVYIKGFELEAAEEMQALTDPTKGGVFAVYAGYWEAVAYQSVGHKDRFEMKIRQYIKDHKNVPEYGALAISRLGWQLFQDKEYKAAQEVYLLLPNGWGRSYMLARCDKELGKVQDSTNRGGESSEKE